MHLLTSLCLFVTSFDYLFFKIIDKQSDNCKSLPVFFRVWKAAGECTHILEGHGGAITSVSVVNSEGRRHYPLFLVESAFWNSEVGTLFVNAS